MFKEHVVALVAAVLLQYVLLGTPGHAMVVPMTPQFLDESRERVLKETNEPLVAELYVRWLRIQNEGLTDDTVSLSASLKRYRLREEQRSRNVDPAELARLVDIAKRAYATEQVNWKTLFHVFGFREIGFVHEDLASLARTVLSKAKETQSSKIGDDFRDATAAAMGYLGAAGTDKDVDLLVDAVTARFWGVGDDEAFAYPMVDDRQYLRMSALGAVAGGMPLPEALKALRRLKRVYPEDREDTNSPQTMRRGLEKEIARRYVGVKELIAFEKKEQKSRRP